MEQKGSFESWQLCGDGDPFWVAQSRKDEDVGVIKRSFTLAECLDNQGSLSDFLQLKQG